MQVLPSVKATECVAFAPPPLLAQVHVLEVVKGYPFSSTDHWMLWSGVVGRDALIGYRLGGHSLLQQPIEQQSARA